MIIRILNAIWWMLIGGLIVSMAWWTSMPTVTEAQHVAVLEERVQLLETRVAAEQESCRLSDRIFNLLREWFAALGLEEK